MKTNILKKKYTFRDFNNNMKRIFILIGLIALSFCQSSYINLPYSESKDFMKGKNSKSFCVVIDAGHGGKHPGTLGKTVKEKEVTLQIALELEKILKKNNPEIEVVMTRKSDAYVDLNDRAEISNKRKANLFVSIHCNANENKDIHGTETYAMGVHKTDGQLNIMKRENSDILKEENYKEKYENFDPNSEESYILFKLQQHGHLNQSLDLARKVEKHFDQHAKRTSRGVKQAGFLVLWKTAMPAILIETGFLSNASEEKYLTSIEGQNSLATSIYKAIRDYKNQHHK